jgi:hypothetical protein
MTRCNVPTSKCGARWATPNARPVTRRPNTTATVARRWLVPWRPASRIQSGPSSGGGGEGAGDGEDGATILLSSYTLADHRGGDARVRRALVSPEAPPRLSPGLPRLTRRRRAPGAAAATLAGRHVSEHLLHVASATGERRATTGRAAHSSTHRWLLSGHGPFRRPARPTATTRECPPGRSRERRRPPVTRARSRPAPAPRAARWC